MSISLPVSPAVVHNPPPQIICKRQWAAAMFILTSDRFANDDRVWPHVDDDLSKIRFHAILADETWGNVHRHILLLAASLYGTGAQVDLGRVLELLSDSSRDLVRGAIAIYLASEYAGHPV